MSERTANTYHGLIHIMDDAFSLGIFWVHQQNNAYISSTVVPIGLAVVTAAC